MDIKKQEKIINAIKKIEFSNIDVVWTNDNITSFHKLIYNSSYNGKYKHVLFNTLDGDLRLTCDEILSLAENGKTNYVSGGVMTITKWGGQVDERTYKVIEKKKYVVGLDADEFGSDANTKMTDEEMYELAINDDEYRFPMYEEREFFYKLNSDEIDTENKCWFLIEIKTKV